MHMCSLGCVLRRERRSGLMPISLAPRILKLLGWGTTKTSPKSPPKRSSLYPRRRRRSRFVSLESSGISCNFLWISVQYLRSELLYSLSSGSWTGGGVCDSTAWAAGFGSDQKGSVCADDSRCCQSRPWHFHNPGGEHSWCGLRFLHYQRPR